MKTQVFSTGPNGEKASPASERHAHPRRTRQGQGEARDGGARVPLRRQRLVERAGGRAQGAVRRRRHRRHRRDRRRLQAGEAGLRPRDGAGEEARHHRLDPGRSGRDGGRLQGRRRQGRQARVHGQRAEGLHRRQGLCELRFRRQLRQWRRGRAPDGQGARRQGRDRSRLPRRRLLRHPPALRRVQEDDQGAVSGHQDRGRAGHRRSRLFRRRREGGRRDPDRAPAESTRSGRSGTCPPKA